MTSNADLVFKDDDAHMVRAMQKRISQLESIVANLVNTGNIVFDAGELRGNQWAKTHEDAVAAKWSRWYQFNDVNETQTFEERGGLAINRPTKVGTGDVMQGQPGALVSEGSYSVKMPGGSSYLTAPYVPSSAGAETIEAVFMPETVPANANIVHNGNQSSSGIGLRVGSAAGGSGSLLTILLAGYNVYSTGVTLVRRNWYHAIASYSGGSVRWSLGRVDPTTRRFSFQTGTIAVSGHAAVASSVLWIGDSFDGWLDEVISYNGSLTATEQENRIRSALQPGAPQGWLVADGAAVSRNKYAQLWRRIGTFNGVGDGSTTFNLPNYPGAIVKL